MKKQKKTFLLPLLFAAGGALAGLIYHYTALCADGMCPLSADPLLSMFYLGVIGWLLSALFVPGTWKSRTAEAAAE